MNVVTQTGGVLCAGRLYCDFVFLGLPGMPELGREIFARELTVAPGGGAFIVAAQLAVLGRHAALGARLGTDPISRGLEVPIAALGVDMRWVERAADAGPQVTMAIPHKSDRAFVTHHAGAAVPATLRAAIASGHFRHLHVAELTTLLEMADLVALARDAGMTVSGDAGWDEAAFSDPRVSEHLRLLDVFLPNAEEAAALTGCDDPQAAAEALARVAKLVVIKAGPGEVRLRGGGISASLRPPSVAARDATGAGDAFIAGFLDRWLDGEAAEACLAWAVAAGSLAIRQAGGASPSSRQDVAAMAEALLEAGMPAR